MIFYPEIKNGFFLKVVASYLQAHLHLPSLCDIIHWSREAFLECLRSDSSAVHFNKVADGCSALFSFKNLLSKEQKHLALSLQKHHMLKD